MTFNSLKQWREISTPNNTLDPEDMALRYSSCVRSGNFIYIIGGLNNGFSAEYTIKYSKINNDGTITDWMKTGELKDAVYGACAVSKGDYIYIMGGYNINLNLIYDKETLLDKEPILISGQKFEEIDRVYYAKKQSDGKLGNWTATSSLKNKVVFACSIISGNYIYIMGGQNGSGSLNTVYRTTINTTNGELAEWTEMAKLPEGIGGASAVTYNNYIYIIGGAYTQLIETRYVLIDSRYVYYTRIKENGDLEEWINLTSATARSAAPSAAAPSAAASSADASSADASSADADVSAAAPSAAAPSTAAVFKLVDYLPTPLIYSSAIISGKCIFVIGGYNNLNSINTVFTAEINQDGTIGLWKNLSAITQNFLREPVAGASAVTDDKYIYIMGGYTKPITNTQNVYSAELTFQNHSINYELSFNYSSAPVSPSWQIISKLPRPLTFTCSVLSGNYIYIIGGRASITTFTPTASTPTASTPAASTPAASTPTASTPTASTPTAEKMAAMYNLNVYSTKINLDGTLDAWSTINQIPKSIYLACAVTDDKYIYLMGGYNENTSIDNIYYAKIRPEGQLENWISLMKLPDSVYGASAVTNKKYIYILGGVNNTRVVNSLYIYKINTDGTLTLIRNLPQNLDYWAFVPLYFASAVIFNDIIYVIGGALVTLDKETQISKRVLSLKINTDGTPGNWSLEVSILPQTLIYLSAVASNNRIFVLGGATPYIQNTVHVANIKTNGTLGVWQKQSDIENNPLPSRVSGASAVIFKNFVYIMGGYNGRRMLDTVSAAALFQIPVPPTTTADPGIAFVAYINSEAEEVETKARGLTAAEKAALWREHEKQMKTYQAGRAAVFYGPAWERYIASLNGVTTK